MHWSPPGPPRPSHNQGACVAPRDACLPACLQMDFCEGGSLAQQAQQACNQGACMSDEQLWSTAVQAAQVGGVGPTGRARLLWRAVCAKAGVCLDSQAAILRVHLKTTISKPPQAPAPGQLGMSNLCHMPASLMAVESSIMLP